MLKTILIVLTLLVAGVLAYAALQPDEFAVQRSAVIQAPPEKIVPHLEDFRRWAAWSPYEKLDPQMRRRYSGPERGVGASYDWDGDDRAGAGRMRITQSSTQRVAIALDFVKPLPGHYVATFDLQPEGTATRLTWSMRGPDPYVGKLMGLFFDRDEMIGKDFETGLSSLATLSET
jgi:hypothetical protein